MNIRFQPRRHVIDLLFTLALFCVFAASALLVVLIGADVYESSARGMDRNFGLQTSLHYVAAKVRQNDAAARSTAPTSTRGRAASASSSPAWTTPPPPTGTPLQRHPVLRWSR